MEVALLLYPIDLVISLVTQGFLIYIILGVSIPILRGILHEKFIIKLKDPYFIKLELRINLIKRKETESQMVKIYLISNKLASELDPDALRLYKDIYNNKWLSREGRFKFSKYFQESNLHFRSFATSINFKEKVLNLVSAIRKWDENYLP
jgi:hypothetical protein